MFRTFFFNRVVYEIMWKNTVQPDGPQMTVCRMHISRLVHKATNTHFWNMYYLQLFHCNNRGMNAPQFNVKCTLPVLLNLISFTRLGSTSMEAAVSLKYIVTSCEAAECVVLNERRVHFHRCEKKCRVGYKLRSLCQKLLKIFIKVLIFMQF